jgi:flagellar hook-associated protein 2
MGLGSNSFRIILSGQTGSDGAFTITSTPDLGFHDTANNLQTAQDAIFDFEGLKLTRSSNTLTDVVDGATLNLMSISTSDVTLNITNDKSALKTNIQEMVNSYNDLLLLFDNFTAVDSEAEMAGALSDDTSIVRFLKTKIKNVVFSNSSSGSGSITALRSIGVSIDQYGKVTFNESEYDAAISASYDDVVTMLTADTSNENLFTDSNKGLAQDVATALADFTDATGVVTVREAGSKTELTDHQDELTKLEARMDSIYNRYLEQFGVMEKLMASLDSTKDYLTSQLETLSKVYEVD